MTLQARSKRYNASSAPVVFRTSNYPMLSRVDEVTDEVGMNSAEDPEKSLQLDSPLKDAMSTDTVLGGTHQSSTHTRGKSMMQVYSI